MQVSFQSIFHHGTLQTNNIIMVSLSWIVGIFVACLAGQLTQGQQCTREKYRPRYHFSPNLHWINDPNGMVWYNGTYHLFYQYHPYSTVWGPMHWGHAVSTNLASWTELDIALEPDSLGAIFSGSAVADLTNSSGFKTEADVDPIVAVYTSAGDRQRQSIAYSNDKGARFTKYEGNPVLVDDNSPDFRDPKVARHGDYWVMTLAVGNRVEFFASDNLKEWRKTGEFGADPEEGSHGGVWECPDLFPLTVQVEDGSERMLWVLLVSIGSGSPNRGSVTQYFIGDFDDVTFSTFPWRDTQWLDWGPDNYASVTFNHDPLHREIYIGWMNNWMYANELPTEAWRGQMTLPRKMGLRVLNQAENQFRLTSEPVDELKLLRNPLQSFEHNEAFEVAAQTVIELTEPIPFTTPLMEVEITVEIENQPSFSICGYNSIEEEVCFGYNDTRWYLDRQKTGNTGFNHEYAQTLHSTAVREFTETEVTIRMFWDVSSVEIFADQGATTMTSLFYSDEELSRLHINHWSGAGSDAKLIVKSYKVWGLLCWRYEE